VRYITFLNVNSLFEYSYQLPILAIGTNTNN